MGWDKVGTQELNVNPGSPAAQWDKVATQALVIAPGSAAANWDKVASVSLTINPYVFQLPSTAKLVFNHNYPADKTYNGAAQKCIAKTTVQLPDQVFGGTWEANRLVNEFQSQIEEQGAEPLSIQVYEDRMSGTFSTDFYLVATVTNPTAASTEAVAFAQIIWVAIIAALAVIALIVIAFTIVQIIDFTREAPAAALGLGLIVLGVAGVAVLGIALAKGTSVKEGIVGKKS